MLTEEIHASGVADKITSHEDAAHDKRNWVRLTYACNDHCVFCLDSDTHDGTNREREEIKTQILDGKRHGATRLILSGGEPTIHPDYIDFIEIGRKAGYRKIQTVTNGRMFSYKKFITQCIDAGLGEITFSIHGPNAKIHDALVGTKGAFEQEVTGLKNALADGRVIVNIDIVINKANVRHLPEMLETFYGWGVKEFDLLQVVPFGRAFTDGRETLFYDLKEARPYIVKALEFSKKPDVHMWFNRFPPEHLEGYEHLIQDPYKLNDEVRGRKEEFARLLEHGIDLDCRDPHRCQYCYVERLCDRLYDLRDELDESRYDVVRVDSEWEAKQEPVFGGDPASSRRSLPMAGQGHGAPKLALAEHVKRAGQGALWIVAPNLAGAQAVLARAGQPRAIELELTDDTGLGESGTLAGVPITRVFAKTPESAARLLAMSATFDVVATLCKQMTEWIATQKTISPRLVLRQPGYERLTEAAESDVDARAFFAKHKIPVEGVPACLSSSARPDRRVLDTAMMTDAGQVEIFRFTQRFVVDHYRVKSLRCVECVREPECGGLHINYARAHGFGVLQPITDVKLSPGPHKAAS